MDQEVVDKVVKPFITYESGQPFHMARLFCLNKRSSPIPSCGSSLSMCLQSTEFSFLDVNLLDVPSGPINMRSSSHFSEIFQLPIHYLLNSISSAVLNGLPTDTKFLFCKMVLDNMKDKNRTTIPTICGSMSFVPTGK